MDENIILKEEPKIEFQFRDNGFEVMDEETVKNSGFYTYDDLKSSDLNSAWYPRVAKWLRVVTWILNGVPYFPSAKDYKKANLILHFSDTTLGIWLTDPSMADKSKRIKELLDEKTISVTRA